MEPFQTPNSKLQTPNSKLQTPNSGPSREDAKTVEIWNDRAATRYEYKGELFYTITPLPAYLWRRNQIVSLIKKTIGSDSQSIADFGCGDGWYIRELKNICPDKMFFGIDSSKQMLDVASEYGVDCIFKERINEYDNFDLIYTVATLAHFDDKSLVNFFSDMSDHLNNEGVLIICEQSAPMRCFGDNWIRRTEDEYSNFAKSCGFDKVRSYLIDYPAHRWFERRIAGFFYDKFKSPESRKKANTNRLFLFASKLFLKLNRSVDENKMGWGYTFIQYKKSANEFKRLQVK